MSKTQEHDHKYDDVKMPKKKGKFRLVMSVCKKCPKVIRWWLKEKDDK